MPGNNNNMSDFKLALPTIWLHEGRYSNDKNDPGGPTNYGVSLRFLMRLTQDKDGDGWMDGDINQDGAIDAEDIKAMSEDDATKIYDLYFWLPNKYGQINDQEVATKMFTLCINLDPLRANKALQRAVRAATGVKLTDDGIVGSQTIIAVNNANPVILHAALKSEAAGVYRMIKYPGSETYIGGWLNRAYSNMVNPWTRKQTTKN